MYFRADADDTIGYGHWVRSLALADMLKEDFECIFCTQSPTDYQKKEMSRVCRYLELPSDDRKFSFFLELLDGDEIVVLDNFFFTTDYQRLIKTKGCKLVCLGTNDKHYVADLIISQSSGDTGVFSVESYTDFCIGLEWALLRAAFLNNTNKWKKVDIPRHLVVCFGGSDFYNLTGRVVKILCNIPFVEKVDVIVGDAYKSDIEIDDRVNVVLHRNLNADEMVTVFEQNDVAILSASSVCVEAMACRIPVLAGYYVDNQIGFYNVMISANYIEGLGNLLTDDLSGKLLYGLKNIQSWSLNTPFPDLLGIISRYIQKFNEL